MRVWSFFIVWACLGMPIAMSADNISVSQSTLAQQLQHVETAYGDNAMSLQQLKVKINQHQRSLKQLKKQILHLRSEMNLEGNALGKQIKAAYLMGKQEKLRLLLNQQDPALASRMLVYYNYFNQARLQKIASIKTSLTKLLDLETQTEAEQKSLQQALKSRKTHQINLAKNSQQRQVLLSQFDAPTRRELDFGGHKLQGIITTLDTKPVSALKTPVVNEGVPFVALKGKLPWPIQGKLVKKFGYKRAAGRWDGVLIAAKEGTEIKAVNAGKVVFADWLRGYGLLVIVDHGQQYMTLYAFNQSLYAKVGDFVQAGNVIATVGKSGGRAKSGLYFGVRKTGKAINPVKWCKKVRRGHVG